MSLSASRGPFAFTKHYATTPTRAWATNSQDLFGLHQYHYPYARVGYEYPHMYVKMFGENYQPPEYVATAHREALAHRWYLTARHITMYDDHSFERDTPIDLEPFADIIGHHFKQPKDGLE